MNMGRGDYIRESAKDAATEATATVGRLVIKLVIFGVVIALLFVACGAMLS